MIRDRGKMKWTSLMLPEHVKLLREWTKEDRLESRKELDEQYLEVLNERMMEAVEFGKRITVTYYRKGVYENFTGRISSWDELNRKLHLDGGKDGGEIKKIPLASIMDVKFSDQ